MFKKFIYTYVVLPAVLATGCLSSAVADEVNLYTARKEHLLRPLIDIFEKMSISETLPIIKSCNLYLGNDTGWLHLASALDLKCIALFMDSPALSYGRYSRNINIITPKGFTEETTTHDTLGKDKIDVETVYTKTIQMLAN